MCQWRRKSGRSCKARETLEECDHRRKKDFAVADGEYDRHLVRKTTIQLLEGQIQARGNAALEILVVSLPSGEHERVLPTQPFANPPVDGGTR